MLIIFLVGGVLLIAGSVLFGLAILRTRVFANWTVWALIVFSVLSTVLFFLPFAAAALVENIATILFVLVFAWFGYHLAFQTSRVMEVTAKSEPSASS